MTPTFAGEIQLAGWSESHTGGCKVTFWLQSNEDLEAFRALTVRKGNTAGHRFMAALVEIGDDEQPVIAKTETTEKPKGGSLSIEAAAMCRNPEYLAWTTYRNEQHAAQAMKDYLGITSRSQIDHNEYAKARFIKDFRAPFMKHLIARGLA